ncbi:MAG: penicillin acylase family protein [Bacteroidetes bacterium]|nr:penicillin acylase family protein [Bacteroidota bacterium]
MKKTSFFGFLICIAAFISPLFSFAQNINSEFPVINPENVTIVRDSFGIPHIFAKTDAEVAYGLAWANAEDAFAVTQDLIYTSKGYMGRKQGIEGAAVDFFVHSIGARELVEKNFEKDLSPEFKKYVDGWVQGYNAYAKAHPNEVKVKSAFPISSHDIVTAYVVIMSALSWTQHQVADAVGGKYDNVPLVFPTHPTPSVGSNAFALNSTKTVDGKTYLCINPHLGMEGQFSFYEAHLQSEEGLNIEGCMFQGSTSLAMGVNEHLGWGMTWNTFDKVDVFKLKMNPKRKLEYEFDGNWVKLEKKPVWLQVNLSKKGKFVLPVKKMSYWSKFGATLKSGKSENYYAIRFPANTTIQTGQQLYKMNKAKNYDEYWNAIRTHAITLFNIVYADDKDNIFYIHHGMMPDRDTTIDWSGLVAGNTSKTLWTKLIPLDSMPKTINPSCGYVFNTNNTPFHASSNECCENGYCYTSRKLMDQRPGDNNRAQRFTELIGAKDKFSLQDLHDIKFDITFSRKGNFAKSMQPLYDLDVKKYPDLQEPLQILNSWNRVSDIHAYAPTLLGLCIKTIFDKYHYDDANFVLGFDIKEEEWVSTLRATCDTLKSNFGSIKVEWGTVNRLVRGNKDLPLRGFPDMLSPSYPKKINSRLAFKADYGDTYTMLASFGKNGVEKLQALQPLGNSLNPVSKHYNDQMESFTKQEMRTLSLKKEDVMKRAESVYHPQ